jgi:hypothetical protein
MGKVSRGEALPTNVGPNECRVGKYQVDCAAETKIWNTYENDLIKQVKCVDRMVERARHCLQTRFKMDTSKRYITCPFCNIRGWLGGYNDMSIRSLNTARTSAGCAVKFMAILILGPRPFFVNGTVVYW